MSIYQHFRPEEREFIDQVFNWMEYVEHNYASKLTDFLNPREQQIIKIIIGQQTDVKWAFFGGAEFTERKRAILYPEYFEVTEADYNISLYEVDYPQKFMSITHPQVLGSLMSLGLKRAKFGDIIVSEDRVQFYCAKEVADFVVLELHSVGKASIQLTEQLLHEGLVFENVWNEQSLTVSSLRLDTMISSIYQISRTKSQTLINAGLTKVNWTSVENTSFECGEGDTLSVRGYGRAKVFAIEGKTKKEKWRISIGRQK
jgi:RNA-binding protein YlmH